MAPAQNQPRTFPRPPPVCRDKAKEIVSSSIVEVLQGLSGGNDFTSGCFIGWAAVHRFTVPGRTGTRTVINYGPEVTGRGGESWASGEICGNL